MDRLVRIIIGASILGFLSYVSKDLETNYTVYYLGVLAGILMSIVNNI